MMKTIIGLEKFWTLFIGIAAVWGATMMLTAVSCSQKKDAKVLVLYYSQTTNTEQVANEIASRLNADEVRNWYVPLIEQMLKQLLYGLQTACPLSFNSVYLVNL